MGFDTTSSIRVLQWDFGQCNCETRLDATSPETNVAVLPLLLETYAISSHSLCVETPHRNKWSSYAAPTVKTKETAAQMSGWRTVGHGPLTFQCPQREQTTDLSQSGPTSFFPRAKNWFPIDSRAKKTLLALILETNSQFSSNTYFWLFYPSTCNL
jgi:hypothetical protein